jgi:hypothetical protein
VAGYTVVKDTDDMQPFHLLVKGLRVTASWRDRLDAKVAQREQALAATCRNLSSLFAIPLSWVRLRSSVAQRWKNTSLAEPWTGEAGRKAALSALSGAGVA